MKLSAPFYHLKRKAKRLGQEQGLAHHDALNRIAAQEGYATWSLLAARHAAISSAEQLYGQVTQGDLVLIGARPGHGKTLMALRLLLAAAKAGNHAVFFTLEYTRQEISKRLYTLGFTATDNRYLAFDCSDTISADHVIRTLNTAPRGTVAAIDYLQLLDQRRENPPLADQIETLKRFARERGLTIVFISQIDRTYDPTEKAYPDMADVRLPNPLDLSLFNKACFLNSDGAARIHTPA